MKHLKLAALAGSLALAGSTVLAGSASAIVDPTVVVAKIGYNAVGKDTLANRNQEYVWVRAVADTNVLDWEITDQWGFDHDSNHSTKLTQANLPHLVYTAPVEAKPDATPPVEAKPATLVLPAGESVIVYTGAGRDWSATDKVHQVYKNLPGGYINNYPSDTLYVLDAKGNTVAKKGYNFTRGYFTW